MLQCLQRTHPILILEGIIYERKKGKKDFWPACCRALQPHLSSEAHPASTPETKKQDKMELLLTASVAHGSRMILNCSQTLLQAELVLSMQTDRRRKKLPLKITPKKTQDKQKTRDDTKAWTSSHPVAACNPGNSHNKGWIERNSTRTRLRQTTNLISLFQNLWSHRWRLTEAAGRQRETKPRTSFSSSFLQNLWYHSFDDGRKPIEKGNQKNLWKHKQKPSVNRKYLPKKEAWDLPKKGVTQGFVRWLSVTGLARIKRWAIRSYNTHHRTISTFFSPTTTIAEAEMRAAYLRPTTRPPKCSVRWGHLFCSLGTHVLLIGNSCSVRWTHILFIWNSCYFRWERTLCSLKTHVLSVGNACFLNAFTGMVIPRWCRLSWVFIHNWVVNRFLDCIV